MNDHSEIEERETYSPANQIHFKFTVQTETGSKNPNPIKEFHIEGDSLHIWYASLISWDIYQNKKKSSSKSAIPVIQTSPPKTLYTIKKIELHHPPDCSVNLTNKVITLGN